MTNQINPFAKHIAGIVAVVGATNKTIIPIVILIVTVLPSLIPSTTRSTKVTHQR
jgi:hypothetical protein